MVPRHIAVVGGGVSGLSSAFHLSRRFPSARISLLEKSDRFGGWIKSERVTVAADDGHGARASVVLEAGPRTLRAPTPSSANSMHVLELVHHLNLRSQLITTPTTSAAALNRFLHIPPSSSRTSNPFPGLMKLPTSLPSLLFSRIGLNLLLPAVLRDLFRIRSPSLNQERDGAREDESVDAFFTAHFGPDFARIFGSALVHGIYAADSRALSVREAFPTLPERRSAGGGSVVRGVFLPNRRGAKEQKGPPLDVGELREAMKGVSVFSFKDGMSTITDALVDDLSSRENVRLSSGVDISRIRLAEDKHFEVETATGPLPERFTHVVSALQIPVLSRILSLPHTHTLPSTTAAAEFPTTSVTVVNLVFASPPASATQPLHPPGFGYLIPRPLDGYAADPTGLGMLGVVFDSCALSAQDYSLSSSSTQHAPSASPSPFVKLTAMLGGPYPSSPHAYTTSPSNLVSDVLAAISSHLGHSLPDPVFARVHTHRSCIPTFAVGHADKFGRFKEEVERVTEGRMKLVGAQATGVSVDSCVAGAREVSLSAWGE